MKTPFKALLVCILGVASYAIFYVVAAEGDSVKTLTFVGHEFEPFYYKSGSQGTQGAMYDLTQEVCKIQNRHCKFKLAQFRNLQNMLATGKADVGGPLAMTPQRAILFYYSAPLFSTQYCFFTMPKNFKDNLTFNDLKDKTVGVFGPSATELSLQRVKEVLNQQLKIAVEPDNHTSLRKAENNTHDFSYVNCETGRFWIEKNRSQLKEITSLGEKTNYHFIFSKKTFTEGDVKAFNDVLMGLKKNGFLQELADKYKLKLAEIGK
jgi:ABC-type amino acid transport substrate-binding protein